MLNYENFETYQKVLHFAEDYVLGMIALQRDKESSREDYVDIDAW